MCLLWMIQQFVKNELKLLDIVQRKHLVIGLSNMTLHSIKQFTYMFYHNLHVKYFCISLQPVLIAH